MLAPELTANIASISIFAWQLDSQTVRSFLLVIGGGIVVIGFVLMRGHQIEYQHPDQKRSPREAKFAKRKFTRRMLGSCLIVCVGASLAAMNWAVTPRAFSILTLIILGLLVALFCLALFDLFNVSIEAISDPQHEKREELVQEVLRLRKDAEASKKSDSDQDESGI